MTGLEAIWVPLVAGAVVGGGTAAARGGDFGDIAKGAGIGAAGGAATGGLASGLGAVGGAAGGQGLKSGIDAVTAPPTPGAIAPAPAPIVGQNIPDTTPNLMSTLNQAAQSAQPIDIKPESWQMPTTEAALATEKPAQTASQWKPSDYINAASSAANVASQIAFRPETPTPQIAPMPAIFSGQGGDLMQQLAQLSQG